MGQAGFRLRLATLPQHAAHIQDTKGRPLAQPSSPETTEPGREQWVGTHRPLVRIFLHQLKVSLPGTMELILVTELLHCAQQVVDDGFKVRAVQVLQNKVEGPVPRGLHR